MFLFHFINTVIDIPLVQMLKMGIFNRQNKDAAAPMRSIRSLSELCGGKSMSSNEFFSPICECSVGIYNNAASVGARQGR